MGILGGGDLEIECEKKEQGFLCRGKRGKSTGAVLMKATPSGMELVKIKGDIGITDELIKKMETQSRIKSKDDFWMENNNRINIDDLDIKIIHQLYNLKSDIELLSTWELTKRIYGASSNKKNMLVNTRLQRLQDYGIIQIRKKDSINPINSFDLIADNVFIQKMTIKKSKKMAMLLNINNNWNIFLRDFLDNTKKDFIEKV